MRIDYTDRLKEHKHYNGVNAKWFDGHTLEEVVTMAMTGSVDMSLFMVKDMYDKNGNGNVDKADFANMSTHADKADKLVGLDLTSKQLTDMYNSYELEKLKIHTHSNKNILDAFNLTQNGLAYDSSLLATQEGLNLIDTKVVENTKQLNEVKIKSHMHSNKDVINALSDDNGTLTYKGNAIGTGGSGGNADLTNVSTHILPSTTQTYDLGSPTNRFRSLYVDEAYLSTNTLYIGDTPVMGTEQDTIVVKADPDQSMLVKTQGLGDTKICSDNNVEVISKGLGSNITMKTEGASAKINLVSLSQINLEAPNVNVVGNMNFTTASVNDFVVKGNLVVEGKTTTIESANLSVADNIIEINKGQTGNGVSLGEAGFKIDRGDSDAYFILFDESDDSLKVGTRSTLSTLASKDWVTAQIPTSLGDMTKAVYDKDNDGIVDKAKAIDGVTTTPQQLNYLNNLTSDVQSQFNTRYTKTEVDNLLANYTPGDLTNYYTKQEVDASISAISLTPGPQGPQGLTGPKGDAGAKGDKGDKGDTGTQGPAGTTTWAGITDKPIKVAVDVNATATGIEIIYDDSSTESIDIAGTGGSGNSHEHTNKTVLDALSFTPEGRLQVNGDDIETSATKIFISEPINYINNLEEILHDLNNKSNVLALAKYDW